MALALAGVVLMMLARGQDMIALAHAAGPGADQPPSSHLATAVVALVGAMMALAATALLLREARNARRRERRLERDSAALSAAYAELEAAKSRAEAKAAQLQATLSGMSDGVMMLDSRLSLVEWNDRFPDLTGVPRDMLRVGVTMEEMVRAQAQAGEFGPMANAEELEALVQRRMARVRSFERMGVIERQRPDGRTLELRRTVLPGGGHVTLYTDITARKQAEAAQREARRLQEAAVEQKAQFVAMVSHEIRAPLNVVIGSLTLLDESSLSSPQREWAVTAREAGDALIDLVNDILDLSRIDAGRLELRPADFELRPLLANICIMFANAAAARGIQLVLDMGPDVPGRLHADSGRVRQVVMNLVSNAVKFSRPGVVTLHASWSDQPACKRAEHGGLMLAVRDQGPPIPPAQAARLFQPFVRLEQAMESDAPGTGLGLVICERLARLMGGSMGHGPCAAFGADGNAGGAAAEGQGNEFWCALPLAIAAPLPAEELSRRPARRARVLLVEDTATGRRLTSALLRRRGHQVDTAERGEQAVAMAARTPYDLVLMDVHLVSMDGSGIDGCEATRRIRALPSPAGLTPIVALTGSTGAEDWVRCREAGMNEILTKPVRSPELFATLERFVDPIPALPGAGDDDALRDGKGPDDADLVDTERLADLQRGLPQGLFARLFEQCVGEIRDRQAAMRDLAAGRESGRTGAPALDGAAHALAGIAGSYALRVVEARMRRLMSLASADADADRFQAEMQGMEDELEQSAELVRRLLHAQAA
jgi:signal transduction histidine kinase/CheY-like chemotaxis protein